MAPVAVATRDRLLDEAERLFARGGVQGVTTREITEAAQQRNTSAVTYHFRSRQGLLLERHHFAGQQRRVDARQLQRQQATGELFA